MLIVFAAVVATAGGQRELRDACAGCTVPIDCYTVRQQSRIIVILGKLKGFKFCSGSVTGRRLAAANLKDCKDLLDLPITDLAWVLAGMGCRAPRPPISQQKQLLLRPASGATTAAPIVAEPGCSSTPPSVCIAQAQRLRLYCAGDETEPVEPTSACKTVSAVDSYTASPLRSWEMLQNEVVKLLKRLLQRHAEVSHLWGLTASSLRLSLR